MSLLVAIQGTLGGLVGGCLLKACREKNLNLLREKVDWRLDSSTSISWRRSAGEHSLLGALVKPSLPVPRALKIATVGLRLQVSLLSATLYVALFFGDKEDELHTFFQTLLALGLAGVFFALALEKSGLLMRIHSLIFLLDGFNFGTMSSTTTRRKKFGSKIFSPLLSEASDFDLFKKFRYRSLSSFGGEQDDFVRPKNSDVLFVLGLQVFSLGSSALPAFFHIPENTLVIVGLALWMVLIGGVEELVRLKAAAERGSGAMEKTLGAKKFETFVKENETQVGELRKDVEKVLVRHLRSHAIQRISRVRACRRGLKNWREKRLKCTTFLQSLFQRRKCRRLYLLSRQWCLEVTVESVRGLTLPLSSAPGALLNPFVRVECAGGNPRGVRTEVVWDVVGVSTLNPNVKSSPNSNPCFVSFKKGVFFFDIRDVERLKISVWSQEMWGEEFLGGGEIGLERKVKLCNLWGRDEEGWTTKEVVTLTGGSTTSRRTRGDGEVKVKLRYLDAWHSTEARQKVDQWLLPGHKEKYYSVYFGSKKTVLGLN